jgi:hypothetical protein
MRSKPFWTKEEKKTVSTTRLINRNITKDQSRDTGMAMVLLLLIFYLSQKREAFLLGALACHIVNMAVPQIYRPVAVVWLGLSHVLGIFTSKIVLTIVFGAVVIPIGLLRKMFGKDSLNLRVFKMSADSVMLARNHTFVAADLEKPY